MQFLSFRVILKRIKAIRFMMADKTVSIWKKALIVAGVVYLFLPIDIIPPFLFPVGILDDIVLWLLILWYLRNELDKYWMGEKTRDLSGKYRKSDIVDDVDFEVNTEGSDPGEDPKKEDEQHE